VAIAVVALGLFGLLFFLLSRFIRRRRQAGERKGETKGRPRQG
jgi:hypothetical protein